jgi:hypothetical protein
MILTLRNLLFQTIKSPQSAAVDLMKLNLNRDALWSALALACVLNTLLFFVANIVAPLPPEMALPMLSTPVSFLIFWASTAVISVFTLYWAGHAIGGKARFADVLAVITWLQLLRVVVQLCSIVLLIASPGLLLVFGLGTALYSLWIAVHFLNVIHGFSSLGKSIFLLVLSFFALVVGLVFLIMVIGIVAEGIL